jgi:hypothetical protein
MSFIRKGLNNRNLEYWRDDIFISYQKKDYDTASLFAYKVCSEQEINKLKERIIKLEKVIKKINLIK